jgi:hypothetical protein
MKGIVFNLLEEVVRAEYGEDAWDDLLERAGLDGAYTSLGGYPDTDMMRLVGVASEALNLPPETIVRWFGRRAIPLLRERYAVFFEGHTSTRSFLLTLNSIIHPEVRKIYPGADVPTFDLLATADESVLVIGYRSARKLCALAEGFIEGTADHFGEGVEIEQSACMHRGADHCLLKVTFTARAA